ncbi:hypothetical protein CesoFtcFv8_024791 [Champsocephalus esox]|uniref:Uncharacterized protein n=1 Tax=Champsocephalus esox TaxID=159716 RepID=A0AAN8GFX4_9TELE|nr:hypothetical protein CesoFtcFv8_024791 [Champsocephalus esox]
MSYDLHPICASCLGPEHADAALSQQIACSHCVRLPSSDRRQRADDLAAAGEEDDWPIQDRDDNLFLEASGGQESDDSYPVSLHGSPCGYPLPPFPRTGESGSERESEVAAEHVVPFSVSTALLALGGIMLELPEIIGKAAACRGLPVLPRTGEGGSG